MANPLRPTGNCFSIGLIDGTLRLHASGPSLILPGLESCSLLNESIILDSTFQRERICLERSARANRVTLTNLKRSFQRRTILNHGAHRLLRLVRIWGLEIISLVMLAAEKSNTSSWSWQDSYAEVDAKGDLKWKPQPFVFEKSGSIRYIDFEKGDDANSGEAPETPWKHHPWDPSAAGKSATGAGVHTYVFKRGVIYRGRLVVKDAGQDGQPIRLTSDPAWGAGDAVLSGSEVVRNWTKGATHKDIPEPEKVWCADLDFAPRSVWNVGKDGAITRIPLARTPNWKVSNPDDVKKEWWVWDNPGKPFGNTTTNARGQTISLGIIREE